MKLYLRKQMIRMERPTLLWTRVETFVSSFSAYRMYDEHFFATQISKTNSVSTKWEFLHVRPLWRFIALYFVIWYRAGVNSLIVLKETKSISSSLVRFMGSLISCFIQPAVSCDNSTFRSFVESHHYINSSPLSILVWACLLFHLDLNTNCYGFMEIDWSQLRRSLRFTNSVIVLFYGQTPIWSNHSKYQWDWV